MFDGKFRTPIDKAVKPIGAAFGRTRLTPDHLTIAGLLVGVGAAFAIGAGYLQLGLLLVVLAALPDLLDGALAKASGSASQRGAFFDSTVDRITDAVLLGGVAWYLVGQDSPYLVMLPFAILALSSLISYQRAKAESLGLDAKGGLMERAERDRRAVPRPAVRAAARPDPVGDGRAHGDHRRPAVRQGVAPGRGGARHRGPHRAAPLASDQPPRRPQRAPPHRVPRRRP